MPDPDGGVRSAVRRAAAAAAEGSQDFVGAEVRLLGWVAQGSKCAQAAATLSQLSIQFYIIIHIVYNHTICHFNDMSF